MIVATAWSFGSISRCPSLDHWKKPYQTLSHSYPRESLCISNQVLNSNTTITHQNTKSCECIDLYKEIVPYNEAWSWQKNIFEEKKALIERKEECPDTLIILQHSPVYTMGTAASEKYLNFDIKNPPFQIYRTERGGEVTYHGPGQLVMYPIVNLRNHKLDLDWYLRALEEVVIRVLFSTFSIKASRVKGLTGVWVGDQKLAAIGIRASQWITYHGLALNVTTDLTPFRWIVPCGIHNRQVGSIKGLLGEFRSSNGCRKTDLHYPDDCQLLDMTHNSLIKEFSEVFQLEVHHKTFSSNLSEILEKTSIPHTRGTI